MLETKSKKRLKWDSSGDKDTWWGRDGLNLRRHPDPHPISLRWSSHVGTLHDLLLIKKPHKYSAAVNISCLTNEVIKQPWPHRSWIHFNNRVSEFLVHNKWSARRCDSQESDDLFTCLCVRRILSNTKHRCMSSLLVCCSSGGSGLSFLLWPVYMREFGPLGLTNQAFPPVLGLNAKLS